MQVVSTVRILSLQCYLGGQERLARIQGGCAIWTDAGMLQQQLTTSRSLTSHRATLKSPLILSVPVRTSILGVLTQHTWMARILHYLYVRGQHFWGTLILLRVFRYSEYTIWAIWILDPHYLGQFIYHCPTSMYFSRLIKVTKALLTLMGTYAINECSVYNQSQNFTHFLVWIILPIVAVQVTQAGVGVNEIGQFHRLLHTYQR